jgi:putative membrane protein
MRHAVRVGILIRVVVNAVALWIATLLVDGIDVTARTTGSKILTLLAVGALFGLVNAIIKPVALLLSLPLIIITLGLFVLVVNALLFWLIAAISDGLGVPFEVDGFWPAFWGAIVVSLVSWLLSLVVKDRDD